MLPCLPANRLCAALLALFLASATASAQEKQATELPIGQQPVQALAAIADGGKLTIKSALGYRVPVTIDDNKTHTPTTRYEFKSVLRPQTFAANQYKAYDVRGNPIPANRVRKALQSETPVLVSADGKFVDPLHLRLYKMDVIVLVVAMSPPPPMSVPPSPVPVTSTPSWSPPVISNVPPPPPEPYGTVPSPVPTAPTPVTPPKVATSPNVP
jgi:hypothetical protein